MSLNTRHHWHIVRVRNIVAFILCTVAVAGLSAQTQSPDPALQQQIEKLAAGQEAMRKELQAMQRQLQEIRALLQRPGTPPPALPSELTIDGLPSKGSTTAVVTLVEFSDFECPFCARHVAQTYPQLESEYIATGKLRYVFRHFPLERIHAHALKAGEAAACADEQGRFWEMHHRLFANQKALFRDDLIKHGAALGLDVARFTGCLDGRMTALVRRDLALGSQIGVDQTPTFFIGLSLPGNKMKVVRKFNGAVPYATFKAAIDALIASAPPTPH